MRLVLVGPPGAGKGTQAVLLSEKLGIPHISTGDLFRANIGEGTELGLEAKSYMDAGNLVPTEITNRMVDARLDDADAQNGFLLDGFPRSVEQADALKEMLAKRGVKLDAVIEFQVDEDTVVERMLARGRADDTEDVIRNRMSVYRRETEPLIDYYKDILLPINAVGTVEEIHDRTMAALQKQWRSTHFMGLFTRHIVPTRTPGELDAMEAAGRIVGKALLAVQAAAVPGVSTLELDTLAESVIRDAGAVPSFKGYEGFPGTICASLNEVVVHGIPRANIIVKEGDLLSVDCGAILDGWHGDSAITVEIGKVAPDVAALNAATREVLNAGIAQMVPGNRLGDISHAIENATKKASRHYGYSFAIIKEFGGQGRNL